MEKRTHEITNHNLGYIEAQIEKMNTSLASHQQQINKWEELTFTINNHAQKIAELQRKLKLIETFESQNFKNNERLFNSHGKLDIVERKVLMLEQTQFKLMGGRSFENEFNQQQLLQKLEIRFRNIEQQLERTKQKSQSSVKFRRDAPLKLPNSQSTHDISIDHGTLRNQLRKMQKKLQESLAQKFATFQKTYTDSLQQKNQQQSMDLQVFSQNQFNRETRVKKPMDQTSQMSRKDRLKPQQEFKHHIDSYYNDDIEKISRVKTQRKNIESRQSFRPNLKQKSKKQKNKSKSLSEERSIKKLKPSQQSKYKKQVKLSSVNQYLRIHEKGK